MNKWSFWIPPIVWMGVIFYFSSLERVHVSDIFTVQFFFFKSLHVIEYGILYLLLYRVFRNTIKSPQWQYRFHAFLIAVVYAMTDEIHQVFVPTREGKLRDVFIDMLGITLAFFWLWKWLPKAPERLKNWAKTLQLVS